MISCLLCLNIAVAMRDVYVSDVCAMHSYLESSGESTQIWCTILNAKITDSIGT